MKNTQNFKKGDLVGFKVIKKVHTLSYECEVNPLDLVRTYEAIQLATVIGQIEDSSIIAIEYSDNVRVVKATDLINVLPSNI